MAPMNRLFSRYGSSFLLLLPLLVACGDSGTGGGGGDNSGGGVVGGADEGGGGDNNGGGVVGGAGEGGGGTACVFAVNDDTTTVCDAPCNTLTSKEGSVCTVKCDPEAPVCPEGTECAVGAFNSFCLPACGDGCPAGTVCDDLAFPDHCLAP